MHSPRYTEKKTIIKTTAKPQSGEGQLQHPPPRRTRLCAEIPFWAQQTQQRHGYQSEAGSFTQVCPRAEEPDSGAHPSKDNPAAARLLKSHWPMEISLQTKLYRRRQELDKTARLVTQIGLSL